MTPEDFLDKWFLAIPEAKQAAMFADLKAVLTPQEGITVESVPNEVLGGNVIVVKCGAYAFEITPKEALRIAREFTAAATPPVPPA